MNWIRNCSRECWKWMRASSIHVTKQFVDCAFWFARCCWIRLKGIWRLLLLLVGYGSGSAHHVAGQFLLGFGFWIEFLVIRDVLLSKNPYGVQSFEWFEINILIWGILLPLFYHQFLIFRNFTLPHSASSAALAGNANIPMGLKITRAVEWCTEFCILLAFGLITGEAGYLYAISYVHASQFSLFLWIQSLLGSPAKSTESLRTDLESLFVAGATIVCILVLFWDVLVHLSCRLGQPGAADRKRYRRFLGRLRIYEWFYASDLLSLGLWVVIAILVLPRFASLFYSDPSKSNAPKFDMLKLIAALYLVLSLLRLFAGIRRLGKAKSFNDAKGFAI